MPTTKLRNYTSEVMAEKSITLIERMIAEFGASNVSKDYDAHGLCVRMTFDIVDPESAMPLHIVLDANEEAVYKALRRPGFQTDRQLQATKQQARRTAWKNMLELLSIQLTMLKLKQRSILQSFLSEAVTPSGKPVHQIMAESRVLIPERSSALDETDIVEVA